MIRPTFANYRIVIPAPENHCRDRESCAKQEKYDCEALLEQVTRHVDYDKRCKPYVDADAVCPFCWSAWEKPPGCCDKAVDAWEKSEEARVAGGETQ